MDCSLERQPGWPGRLSNSQELDEFERVDSAGRSSLGGNSGPHPIKRNRLREAGSVVSDRSDASPVRDFGDAGIEERIVGEQQDDHFQERHTESRQDRDGEQSTSDASATSVAFGGASAELAPLRGCSVSLACVSAPVAAVEPASVRRSSRRGNARGDSEPLLWVSDQELVQQILAGSREHFDLLYETYFPRVYRFALKRLSDPGEAEDVAQEVFMTLMTALGSFKGESTLLVWIFGVTRNKVNRRFRRPRPRLEPLEEGGALDVEAGAPLADDAVDARRMLGRCEAVIENELTPLQRRIFHLKHLRRQPIRAIALALGKSEDAVKANLYRMRRAIADGTPGLEGLLQG
jgi:RNA polymerase sigma factor (sigma-70 family)